MQRERGGVDGLDGAEGVALDAGNLDQAADRVAGHAEMVLHADLGGVLDLLVAAAERGGKPAAAIEQATPTSPWQPTSAPEIEAFLLYSTPIAAAVSRKRRMPASRRARAIVAVIAQHRGNDAGRAVGRRGHDAAAGGVLLVDGHREEADPVHDLMRRARIVQPVRLDSAASSIFARRRTLKAARQLALA